MLELVNEFSKVAGYKINTHRYSHFFTLIIICQKKEVKKTITIPSKRIKFPGINLIKDVKYL